METIGFDVTRVVSAMGTAPLPDDGAKRYAGHRPHERLHSVWRPGAVHRACRGRGARRARQASARFRVGRLRNALYDIFKRYDNDFYKIDPMLFSPAEVWLTSAYQRRTFHLVVVDAGARASLFD